MWASVQFRKVLPSASQIKMVVRLTWQLVGVHVAFRLYEKKCKSLGLQRHIFKTSTIFIYFLPKTFPFYRYIRLNHLGILGPSVWLPAQRGGEKWSGTDDQRKRRHVGTRRTCSSSAKLNVNHEKHSEGAAQEDVWMPSRRKLTRGRTAGRMNTSGTRERCRAAGELMSFHMAGNSELRENGWRGSRSRELQMRWPCGQERYCTVSKKRECVEGYRLGSILYIYTPGPEWGHFSAREFQAQDQPTFFMVWWKLDKWSNSSALTIL